MHIFHMRWKCTISFVLHFWFIHFFNKVFWSIYALTDSSVNWYEISFTCKEVSKTPWVHDAYGLLKTYEYYDLKIYHSFCFAFYAHFLFIQFFNKAIWSITCQKIDCFCQKWCVELIVLGYQLISHLRGSTPFFIPTHRGRWIISTFSKMIYD